MTSVFFSYSHKDEVLRDQLEVQLTMLKREALIETWHDRRITAGEDLGSSILSSLDDADVILLLVSPDFLASEYCWGVEVSRAMARHEAGKATVIPVILRFCEWQKAPFGKLLAAPKDGRPVSNWPDRDEAFLDVARMIRSALGKQVSAQKPLPNNPRADVSPIVPDVRSSNLRISKRFSDADKDAFLHDTFDYIGKFFDGSLIALKERNTAISVSFRRIDANRFTATAYRDGQKEAACTVWIGGDRFSSSGISYSNNDSGATGSMNEELTVEADDQLLSLKALMNGYRYSGRDKKLTMQGAAEYLWDMFIEPLQRSSAGR
jgi:hypothetical protein